MPKAKTSSRKTRARAAKGAAAAGDAAHKVIDCALDLAAERGWRRASLADIAAAAKLSLAELYLLYPSKNAILASFVGRIDRAMLAGGAGEGESPRERLFDLLMRRFEALKPHRAAVEAILSGAGADPIAALCGAKRLLRSMAWTLEAAGIPASGILGRARAKGLAALYLATLRVWLGDETPDLSRTMAALDKGLRRLQQVAEICRPLAAWRGRRAAA
jgi:AcrR family transcriptional regulator